MGRPTSKEDLILAANTEYSKMQKLLSGLTEEQRKMNFIFTLSDKDTEAHWQRDKNIRDVIIHLYEWQKLLLNWYKNNQSGQAVQFLKVGYNWKTYGTMNQEFWEMHQNTSLEEALKLLEKSHNEILSLITNLTNEELFTKGVFSWVGNSAFGQYFVSTTSSHYDWAMKKIKRHIKSLQ